MTATRLVLLLLALNRLASGQLLLWPDPIPKRDKPPVVFVTGHDAVCPDPRSGELPFLNLTFGDFDQVMARNGRVSLVFEACYVANRPSIEVIANLLGQLIAQLRHEGGEPVREVDVVAHSMGGLVVRSYLAGKQPDGTFRPPADPRIRKIVFIGTPHFGTHVASSISPDPQLRAMSPGSAFLFDLATWNAGTDDLRGIESIAISGTGGKTGPATDSVVTLFSSSLDFAMPGKTAVFPFCHTAGGLGQLFLCDGDLALARVKDESHPTAQLVVAFLNDRPYTLPPGAQLNTAAGILIQSRTAGDALRPIGTASLLYENGTTTTLAVSGAGLAHADMVPAGPATLIVDGVRQRITIPAGGTRAWLVKPGPMITAVEPQPGPTLPRAVAPGMLITISGTDLIVGTPELTVGDITVPVLSAASNRLTAVLPETLAPGITDLRVMNSGGRHTVRILVEPSFPVLLRSNDLAAAIDAVSGQPVTDVTPAPAGSIVSLFLTGLNGVSPAVQVGGFPCEVLYAGRAPTLPGIDQINCRLAPETPARNVSLEIRAGMRTALGRIAVSR